MNCGYRQLILVSMMNKTRDKDEELNHPCPHNIWLGGLIFGEIAHLITFYMFSIFAVGPVFCIS